mmetsp:Transcript_92758/g.198873  ORF Transcript_92758/g.198873 Transcript_92758/m.198873 type:complete len:276 (+) Transcript_92758:609-1436(+)
MLHALPRTGPPVQVLLEHPSEELPQLHKPLDAAEVWLDTASTRLQGVCVGVAGVASLTGDELECRHAQRMDVAPRGPKSVRPDLRWNVPWGAARVLVHQEVLSQAEVDNYNGGLLPVGGVPDHYVGLLEVAVHDAPSVQVRDPLEHLIDDSAEVEVRHLHPGHRSVVGQLAEVASSVGLQNRIHVARVAEDLVQVLYPRVVQGPEHLELGLRLGLAQIRPSNPIPGTDLDDAVLHRRSIPGEVYRGLSTLAHLAPELVVGLHIPHRKGSHWHCAS